LRILPLGFGLNLAQFPGNCKFVPHPFESLVNVSIADSSPMTGKMPYTLYMYHSIKMWMDFPQIITFLDEMTDYVIVIERYNHRIKLKNDRSCMHGLVFERDRNADA
jgi:hypothetical protein